MRTSRIVARLYTAAILLAFASFWGAVTIGFDVKWARSLVQQIDAEGFPFVEGQIVAATLTSKGHDGRQTAYADVSYRYTVDGRAYTGTRVRYGIERGEAIARDFVTAHPAGTGVRVYYNSADPSEAVLLPGVYGIDLYMPLFLLPFNAVLVALVVGVVLLVRGAFTLDRLDVTPVPGGVRVRLSAVRPVYVAVAAAGVAGFVLIFVVGFSTVMSPSVGTMIVAWAAVIAFAGWAWLRAAGQLRRGAYDLDVNALRRTVTLPLGKKEIERRTMKFDDCERVDVVQRLRGNGEDRRTKHAVRLAFRKEVDGRREVDLAEYSEPEEAGALRDWLAGQLWTSR